MKMLSVIAAFAASCFAQSAPPVANSAYKAIVAEAQSHVKLVDIEKFKALRAAHPDALLVDTRETEEWVTGHASGAIHISKGVIEKEIESRAPKKDATIVLYCHSGARSALAAENLMRMGYSNVYSLDGGITAYQAAGMPMVK